MTLLAGCGPTPEHADADRTTETAPVPDRKNIILATTTSTQDSGLLDVLVPLFEKQTGYRVKTIAVGTGETLAMGKRGDADVLLAHAPEKEQAIVDAGFAVNRRIVMHNDFLIVGPEDDPAGIHGSDDGAGSVVKIAEAGARFASRGDNSGTHLREMILWNTAAVEPDGDWYISTGQGMGATLLIAAEKRAYVLTDRGTYLATLERTGLVAHVEGDPVFLNLYSVMEVNPELFPKVNHAGARAFSEFLRGDEAQEIIRVFGVDKYGQPLFIPDAGTIEEPPAG
jgi:tungstate transport system substrate-binding protein